MRKPLNLTLHVDGFAVETQAIYEVATPEPEGDWFPIPHGFLLDQVRDFIGQTGLKVVHEQHALAREGNRYFGLLQIEGDRPDYDLVVGLRNAHDKAFKASLGVGSGVFICDNLSFSADIVIGRKHTRFIKRDLPLLVQGAVGKLIEYVGEQDRRLDVYKATALDTRDAYATTIELVKRGAIVGKDLLNVVQEWDEPSYPEFAEHENVWRLFNAVTTACKPNVAVGQRRTQALHGVCDRLSFYQPKVLDNEVVVEGVEDTEIRGHLREVA